jgi:hypothetical protein
MITYARRHGCQESNQGVSDRIDLLSNMVCTHQEIMQHSSPSTPQRHLHNPQAHKPRRSPSTNSPFSYNPIPNPSKAYPSTAQHQIQNLEIYLHTHKDISNDQILRVKLLVSQLVRLMRLCAIEKRKGRLLSTKLEDLHTEESRSLLSCLRMRWRDLRVRLTEVP